MKTTNRPASDAIVMLVADDDALRGVLRPALEAEGYRVLLRTTAARAGEIAAARPDVLILDVHPTRRGSEWRLVEDLKASPRSADLPIVICSGEGAFVAQADVRLRSQVAAVLAKPLTLDNLLPVVATAIATHPMRGISTLLSEPPLHEALVYTGGIPG